MQFLIPILTTNNKHDEHSLPEAEHIYIPQLQSFRLNENRCIVFNNNTTRREKAFQIGELTKLIAKMQIENRQKYYSNKSFEKLKTAIQKSEKLGQKIKQPFYSEIITCEDAYSLEDTP